MNRKDQLETLKKLDAQMIELVKSKGGDYASEEEVLGNFKRISKAAKILNIDVHTSYGYALFMVLLKMDRITNLLGNNKIPNNEGVEDSFLDGINYFKLAYCCNKDVEKDEKENI